MSEPMHDRIDEAAKRAEATKSEWVTHAIEIMLEVDEGTREEPHVPKAIRDAMPRYDTEAARVFMPEGRVPGVR